MYKLFTKELEPTSEEEKGGKENWPEGEVKLSSRPENGLGTTQWSALEPE